MVRFVNSDTVHGVRAIDDIITTFIETYPPRGTAPPDPLAPLFDGSLAPHVFDHRCHVFAAWASMRRLGMVEGAAQFRAALRAYVGSLGAADKYSVTITEALLRLVAHEFVVDLVVPGWEVAWSRFDRRSAYLLESSRAALAPYYSEGRLAGVAARGAFVMPDLKPLPATQLDAVAGVDSTAQATG